MHEEVKNKVSRSALDRRARGSGFVYVYDHARRAAKGNSGRSEDAWKAPDASTSRMACLEAASSQVRTPTRRTRHHTAV